jgi:CTP synthase
LIGKYNELQDAYKSIYEAFIHAGAVNECKVLVVPIHSETLEVENVTSTLEGLDGILVAPGFGERGISGKFESIRYVRENKVPFFGICLGMQCAVIEFARNVAKIKGANSLEFDAKTKDPVIDLMEDQKKITTKGGTMRLGSYPCKLVKGSLTAKAYGKTEISERHRHRYEFNNKYLKKLETEGLQAVGINPESNLVEVIELKDHPYFVGVQFHPELKSTVENPHPLFVSFIKAAMQYNAK